MKVLFIGGTGFISTAVSRRVIAEGHELYRAQPRAAACVHLPGARVLTADIHRPEDAHAALRGLEFDVVVDWIAYTPDDVERDLALFRGRVGQYVFISSASAYQKPPSDYLITESTPLSQPLLGVLARQDRLRRAPDAGVPRRRLPGDDRAPFDDLRHEPADRRRAAGAPTRWPTGSCAGRPIIVHGDGTSLWVVTHADDFARGFLGLLGNERASGRPSTSPPTRC